MGGHWWNGQGHPFAAGWLAATGTHLPAWAHPPGWTVGWPSAAPGATAHPGGG